MYEKRDNSGIIADNDKKLKDTHPDMTGSVTINGTEMWVSGWWKDGRRGRLLSLAFKPKEEKYNSPRRGSTPGAGPPSVEERIAARKRTYAEDLDDEIPF